MEVLIANKKVLKFINSLDKNNIAEIDRMLETLKQKGNLIREPDSKHIGDQLYELRLVARFPIRILYMFFDNKAVIVHAFIKKSNKIPRYEIAYARKIKKWYTTLQ